jgi:hypothetical protein
MADKFDKFYSTLDSPASFAFEITPNNSPMEFVTRSIYVGSNGDLVVSFVDNPNTALTFENILGGQVYQFRISTVYANTTCTGVVGMF